MKFPQFRRHVRPMIRVFWGIVVLFPVLLPGSPFSSDQRQHEKLSKEEVKALIATAKTPEDHLRIAAYYRVQADHYLAKQKEHLAEEEEYNGNPQRYSTNWPTMGQHCRDWRTSTGNLRRRHSPWQKFTSLWLETQQKDHCSTSCHGEDLWKVL